MIYIGFCLSFVERKRNIINVFNNIQFPVRKSYYLVAE